MLKFGRLYITHLLGRILLSLKYVFAFLRNIWIYSYFVNEFKFWMS